MVAARITEIASRLLAGERKRLFRKRPLFEPFEPYHRPKSDSGSEVPVPRGVEALLSLTGYGDLADVLSFRSSWMHVIDRGQLTGHVIFAQDDSGNHYACSVASGEVHFLSRSSPEYALMSASVEEFFEEFERHGFLLHDWTDGLDLKPYNWA